MKGKGLEVRFGKNETSNNLISCQEVVITKNHVNCGQ